MKIVYAADTVSISAGGRPVMIRKGTHWRADDPVVLEHPSAFSDDPRYGLCSTMDNPYDEVVEQATAAPGELRQTSRRG